MAELQHAGWRPVAEFFKAGADVLIELIAAASLIAGSADSGLGAGVP